MNRILPVLFVIISLGACTKNGSSGTSLTGKWLQTGYYYDTAGTWSTVTDANAYKIEFKNDGSYKITPPIHISAFYCPGTYNVVNDSTLVWGWSCTNPPVENTNKFSKEGDELIIFYSNVRSNYQMKFKKVKRF